MKCYLCGEEIVGLNHRGTEVGIEGRENYHPACFKESLAVFQESGKPVAVQKMDRRENRCKILYVDQRLIVDLLNAARDGKVFVVPPINGMPPDCQVEDVTANWNRRCLALRLWHESFDVVTEGNMIPEIDGVVHHGAFELRPGEGVCVRWCSTWDADGRAVHHEYEAAKIPAGKVIEFFRSDQLFYVPARLSNGTTIFASDPRHPDYEKWVKDPLLEQSVYNRAEREAKSLVSAGGEVGRAMAAPSVVEPIFAPDGTKIGEVQSLEIRTTDEPKSEGDRAVDFFFGK